MADTTFTDQTTTVSAEWLNDINDFTYDGNPLKYIPRTEWAALYAGTSTYDSLSAIQSAMSSTANPVRIPECFFEVSGMFTIPDNKVVEGAGKGVSRIKLQSGAANGTNICSVGQYVTIRNLWLRGNWDGATAGQLGVGIYGNDLVAGHIHGLTLENVAVDKCKSNGIYIYEGAYIRMWNTLSDTCGLNATHLEGASPGSFTTTEIGGESTFSSCPNGYGLLLKNCLNSKYSFISEYTLGVGMEGEHRGLDFDSCYYETSAGGQNYIYNVISGGALGVRIHNNFLGMTPATAVIQGDANHQNYLITNNNNLTTKPYMTANWGNAILIDSGKVIRAKGTSCMLDAQYTTTGNVGVGEDTLFTYTIPGGTMYTDGVAVKIRAWGKTASNANNKTLKIHFGSTVMYNSGALAANDRDWAIDATVVRVGATDQRFSVNGVYNAGVVISCSTTTQTLASDVIIKVTGEATSNNDITIQGWTIELIDLQSLTF